MDVRSKIRSLTRKNRGGRHMQELNQSQGARRDLWHKDYIKAAQNNISVTDLKKLASHNHYRVRARVAEHPHTPIQVLYNLALDPHFEVRSALVARDCIPAVIFELLLADECPEVRYELAENPYLEMNRLLRLTEDTNPYVSERAWRTLNTISHRRKNTVSVAKSVVADKKCMPVNNCSPEEDALKAETAITRKLLAS